MCYNNSLSKNGKYLEARFKATTPAELEPIYYSSGFAHPLWPVITNEDPGSIQLYNWGLVPIWAKDTATANQIRVQTLNARGEEVFEKPSYKYAIQNNRCLVLSDGFFEWMDCNKKKYPHYIHLKDNEAFAMAGIWSKWTDKNTGETRNTYSILTCEANPMMAKIHNLKLRMPVILPRELERDWLKPDLKKEEILQFVHPYDESLMDSRTISKLITSRKENPNVPEVMDRFVYEELNEQSTLF